MQKFMPDADHKERLQTLEHTAESIRNEEYYADLTQEVLDRKREEFSLNAIELNKIEEKKKTAVDGFKEQMKPLNLIYNELLEQITIGKERKEGKLYDIIDAENSMMLTYDEFGDLVVTRRLRPEEKKGQSRMFIPGGFQAGPRAAND